VSIGSDNRARRRARRRSRRTTLNGCDAAEAHLVWVAPQPTRLSPGDIVRRLSRVVLVVAATAL